MKTDLFIKDEDVDSLLHAVIFMSDVALGVTTQVDYFTDEEIKGLKFYVSFFFL